MLEMSIDSIRVSVVNSQRVVILKDKQSNRYLPIWIGSAEADAIAIKLQGVTVHHFRGNHQLRAGERSPE